MTPARDDLAGRADALMYFYERETNTIIAQPLIPLRERTKYAVVVTRRLKDTAGDPVGSPYEFINHTGQTGASELFTRRTIHVDITRLSFYHPDSGVDFVAVRDGLYGRGVETSGEEFPAKVDKFLTSSMRSILILAT